MLRRAIDLQPGNWRSIDRLGALYFETGRYEEAVLAYRQVVFLDPTNWVGQGNLGSALMMTGDFAAAVDPLDKSLGIERDAYFLSNLGTIYLLPRRIRSCGGDPSRGSGFLLPKENFCLAQSG